jgi:hypothetical protein
VDERIKKGKLSINKILPFTYTNVSKRRILKIKASSLICFIPLEDGERVRAERGNQCPSLESKQVNIFT